MDPLNWTILIALLAAGAMLVIIYVCITLMFVSYGYKGYRLNQMIAPEEYDKVKKYVSRDTCIPEETNGELLGGRGTYPKFEVVKESHGKIDFRISGGDGWNLVCITFSPAKQTFIINHVAADCNFGLRYRRGSAIRTIEEFEHLTEMIVTHAYLRNY